LKNVLIISPHFPPINAADMHRVRQALPYLEELGWHPVVITVDEAYIESYSTDPLLLQTIPAGTEIHKVKAFETRHTRKLGLGSLSMRSYWHIRKKGNELLKKYKFDLVYFSTTAFHVMALGPYWKRKFKVPFIVDIQDPWRNDFYLDKPASERPPKFFIAYNIDKYLEAKTIPFADGIISVSKGYCETFIQRYPSITEKKCRVIPFGVAAADIDVMRKYISGCGAVSLPAGKINIVYVGRGGYDMSFAVSVLFKALKKGLETGVADFKNIHCWFIGTSYAPPGTGNKTILPVAVENKVQDQVTEITDRVPYFETLYLLDKADIVFVPGSVDTHYTASKIYPYLVLQKKLLAVFNKNSSVVNLLQRLNFGELVVFDQTAGNTDTCVSECYTKLCKLLAKDYSPHLDSNLFAPYTAGFKTKEQVDFFNEVLALKTPVRS
jgi:Glycosyltransferase Family 4